MADAPTPETLYLLPDTIRQQLLAYLRERPYREVAGGVQAILALSPAPAADAASPARPTDAPPINDP